MKFFFSALIIFLASFQVNAESVAPPVLTLEHPGGGFTMDPVSSKIEVFVNGNVVKTVINGSDVKFTKITTLQNIKEVTRCATELDKEVFNLKPTNCTDDPGSYYKGWYGKSFAARHCSHLQSAESCCATEMVKLLDALDLISRY